MSVTGCALLSNELESGVFVVEQVNISASHY